MHDVFISYSKTDKPAADAACATLEQAGIRCWIAPRDIRSGSYWPEEIVGAIDHCRVMVLIFSAEANISSQVLREVEKAVRKGMPIFPMRIENVEPTKSMEHFLNSLHWLDALTPPLEKHLQTLARDVKTYLDSHSGSNSEPPPPPPPPPPPRRWWLIAASVILLAIGTGGAIYLLTGGGPNCDTAYACNELGDAYNGKEQWDEAIRAFKKAINLDPNRADYVDLGWAYAGKHEWDPAISAFSKAIKLDPNPNDPWLAAAYVDRGYDYAAQKNWSQAIADYDEAIRLNPKDASAFYYRGQSKEALGDRLGGEADKAQAHKIDPKKFP